MQERVARTPALLAALILVATAVFVASPVAAKPRFKVTVRHHVVHSGERLVVEASATTRCRWVVDWNGRRRVAEGRAIHARLTAPQVVRKTRLTLLTRCFYRARTAPAALPGSGNLAVSIPPSWRKRIVIMILPKGPVVKNAQAQSLPNTGGPPLRVLLAGIGSVVVGAAAVRRGTRVLR